MTRAQYAAALAATWLGVAGAIAYAYIDAAGGVHNVPALLDQIGQWHNTLGGNK
jgi:hypothetical protein